jgi:DHA1 family tetracycline resistance protein-like MFS transporter
MGIAGLIGPGVFTLTFAQFIGDDAPLRLPGAPFFLAAVLLACAAFLSVVVTRPEIATPNA